MACAVPQKCSPRFKSLLRLYICLPLLLSAGWLAAAVVYLPPLYILLAGICTALFIIAALFLPGMLWERLYYTRHARWLKLERGLFVRTVILIPRGQIICTRLRRSLPERLLGLCTVILVTTAGRVAMPGLTAEDAGRLRELADIDGDAD